MKLVARRTRVDVVVNVDCPTCQENLGIVSADTGECEDFECFDCHKTFHVEVQMRRNGRADLKFYEED